MSNTTDLVPMSPLNSGLIKILGIPEGYLTTIPTAVSMGITLAQEPRKVSKTEPGQLALTEEQNKELKSLEDLLAEKVAKKYQALPTEMIENVKRSIAWEMAEKMVQDLENIRAMSKVPATDVINLWSGMKGIQHIVMLQRGLELSNSLIEAMVAQSTEDVEQIEELEAALANAEEEAEEDAEAAELFDSFNLLDLDTDTLLAGVIARLSIINSRLKLEGMQKG